MKIAVCLKRVPEMELRILHRGATASRWIRAGSSTKSVTSTATPSRSRCSWWRRRAAVRSSAICLGPDGVQETLRKALAMGATRAIQLKADEVPFDGSPSRRALAAELKDGGYDLILFGRMATDTGSGTVGPMTARAARSSLRHRHLPSRARRRPRHRAARSRGRRGDGRVSSPGRAHDRRRHRAAAPGHAQGHHGRQEEAARRAPGAARARCD